MKPKAKPASQKVKYVGKKAEIRVQFPVPFISRSEAEGDPIVFRKGVPVELRPSQAAQLVNCSPAVFKMVDDEVEDSE